ncbi:MAG: hypothetical protein V1775_09640 [Bacteroidota bacterium]
MTEKRIKIMTDPDITKIINKPLSGWSETKRNDKTLICSDLPNKYLTWIISI